MRMRAACCPILALSVCLVLPAMSRGAEWELVFEDDFERAEPGELYVPGDRAQSVSIEDGRLLVVGRGASVLIDRPFAMDVRLEFDAQAWPERAPCDLSVLLNRTYLLGFGARSNSANHLIGPGLDVVDEDPPFVIEPGKRYHIVAQREGKRITYQVDDTLILEGSSDHLIGGPSFDRLGFITWSGMYVDNVTVHERRPRHPDTPDYMESVPGLPLERDGRQVQPVGGTLPADAQAALDALNAGDYEKAKRRFDQVDDVVLRLSGLAHLYGDVNYIEPPVTGDLGSHVDFGELGAFAERWKQAVKNNPDNAVLAAYLPAVRNFGRLVLSRSGRNDAKLLVDLGPEGNPFYHKARLFQARYLYWDGMEGANSEVKGRAHEIMRELFAIWPDNRVLREYVGEPVPWGQELNADPNKHPAWAAYLREAYAREIAVMERLCDLRQTPDGQFGGGWGDDVEMMRKWVPIAAISTCSSKVIDGITHLTEGIRRYHAPRGFSEGIADVEHSSEPTADSFPTMLLLQYGDPRYHDFNLDACRIIRDVMMGIDDQGYPRFKATEIGAKGVNQQLIGGGDTGYHARAMKHFLWLAWYGNVEARDLYVRWVDGWRNTIMIEAEDKPEGMAPGTIWYPSGSYNPPNGAPWYSEKAENYYGVGGLPVMIHRSIMAAYALTGDRKYLHAIQRMMDHATYGPYVHNDEAEPPSMAWARQHMVGHSDAAVTALYRMFTGEGVYDEYTRRFGTAPQVYQIDHDLDHYMERIEKAAKSLRHNLWYYTTEVLSTDRLHLPAVPDVWGAYTGAITTTVDAEFPTMGVTYETPDANFAALVTENHPHRLRVWLYSFWDEPTEITLRFWRLTPGVYARTQGSLQDGERPFQHRYRWGDPDYLPILEKGDRMPITLPPKTVWVVDLRLHDELETPERVPDLAIHGRDVIVEDGSIKVVVHNIGSEAAESFAVAVESADEEETVLAEQVVDRLPAPVDFRAFTREVTLRVDPADLRQPWRVVVDPYDECEYELCETNNIVEMMSAR